MELNEMNLEQVETRLAALDIEVEAATKADEVELKTTEKKALLERKAELFDLQERKKMANELEISTEPAKIIESRKEDKPMNFEDGLTKEQILATPEYRSGFYKSLMGQKLNDVEKRANEIATTDAAGVIPTAAINKVFDLMRVYAPLLDRCTLFRIPGPVTLGVEGTNTAAAIHTQNAAVTPSADVLTQVSLGSYEIMKVLRVSASLANQSVDAFESWLIPYLAKGMAAKIGSYLLYGSNSSQPKGIDYMDSWSDGTNAVDWATAALLPAEILEQISYLKPGYHSDAVFVMAGSTKWGQVATIQADSNYKLFSEDYKRLFGYEILLDDNCAAGDIFFGSPSTIVANLSQDITIARSNESGFLNNATDYRATCAFDSDFFTTEGWVKSAADLTAGA